MGHIYCLTIDEFDWLVTAIGRGHLSVGSVLQRAVERDSNPQTMCFLFSQHLNQEDRAHDVDVPEYISQEFDELTRRCMTKIKENAG
jgi:hypothetical protein